MGRPKYKLIDEEGTEIDNGRPFNLKCCDCGLIHRVCVYTDRARKGVIIGIAMERDDRKTGAERRQMRKRKEGLFAVGMKGPITKQARLKLAAKAL